jgi:hypothetical protein
MIICDTSRPLDISKNSSNSLDNLLVPDKQGISSHQIIEICGSVNSEVSVVSKQKGEKAI